ncbi:hypothetical protein F5051DRAFT_433784, partial [Lentinula edodes]
MIISNVTSKIVSEEGSNPFSFHAVINSAVFTFINRKPASYPSVPSKTEIINPSPHATAMANFYTPKWVASSLPFLGFAPSSNPFKCEFLRCLDYSAHTLPITGNNIDDFALDLSLQTDWDSLERNFRAFLRACMFVNRFGVPENFRLWAFPLQYGYKKLYKNQDKARAAAHRSRQAFIPLIASVSFFLRLLYHLENEWGNLVERRKDIPAPPSNSFWSDRQNKMEQERYGQVPSKWEWQEKLRERTSISAEWLSYFHEIMDIPMVGLFFDVHHSGCLSLLSVFLETKMPLVLYWGSTNDWRIPLGLPPSIPVPSRALVNHLMSKQIPYSPPAPTTPPTSVAVSSTTNIIGKKLRIPRLDGGTQPRKSEGVIEFLKRREIDRLRKIASEDMKDRQSRLQREKNASRDMPPGRKGARVYYWDMVEGIRVRTAVGRNNYEDIWERYGQRQRHYDSVADEWDICTELDPNDEPSYPDDDDDDGDDYFIFASSAMGEDTAHNIGPASSLAYLARLLPSSDSDERVVFDEPVDDIVVHRFGFAPDGHSTDRQYSCPEK